jgi:quinol monooxygenase YgiN
VIIVAGWLRVAATDRKRYRAAVADVARLARAAPGCLDVTQAASVGAS